MRRILPYLLGFLLLAGTLFVLFRKRTAAPKKVSTFITLSKHDKNPYGAYIFYNSLKNFFPNVPVLESKKSIYQNRNLGSHKNEKLFVILTPNLEMPEKELNDLRDYIDKGNTVFISTFDIGYDFEKLLGVDAGSNHRGVYPFGNKGPFNMKQTLQPPVFKTTQTFSYPGQDMEGYFYKADSAIARTLGRGNNGRINFVHLRRKNGNLFIHMSPMAFSNYFLLYDDNHKYLEQIFSLLTNAVDKPSAIIWDSYYSGGSSSNNARQNKKPNWLTSIMKEPSFRAGILTALLLMFLYTISEMRRRQRMIPAIKSPTNDSLEFVKTVGLLYYQKKDHQNLAQKMSTYFLEHVRNKYRIFARELDANFIKEVSYKSGASEKLVGSIVNEIKRVNSNIAISDVELIALQRNIEEFYNK